MPVAALLLKSSNKKRVIQALEAPKALAGKFTEENSQTLLAQHNLIHPACSLPCLMSTLLHRSCQLLPAVQRVLEKARTGSAHDALPDNTTDSSGSMRSAERLTIAKLLPIKQQRSCGASYWVEVHQPDFAAGGHVHIHGICNSSMVKLLLHQLCRMHKGLRRSDERTLADVHDTAATPKKDKLK